MATNKISFEILLKQLDWVTIILYLMLITMGWFCVAGASHNIDDPSLLDFAARSGKQFIWIICSIILGLIILLIDKSIYETFALFIYVCMMGLLLITPFLASNIKGSYSWITLGPVSIQPAEFAKCVTALALAKVMGSPDFSLTGNRKCFIHAVLLVLIPILFILTQHETGSALVYFAFLLMFYREGMSGSILFTMLAIVIYFVVGLKYNQTVMPHTLTNVGATIVLFLIWLFTTLMTAVYSKKQKVFIHILWGGLILHILTFLISTYIYQFNTSYAQIGICIATILYLVYMTLSKKITHYIFIALFALGSILMFLSVDYIMNNILQPHQQTRIKVQLGLEEDLNGAGYNVRQSVIAIGSGGWFGKGFLNGTQTKLKYVPEQDTDFIFCTIGEEWGFVGSTFVLIVYLILILRLIVIAERQTNDTSRIYGYCVLSIFMFHLFINVGMVMGMVPVIGIPLPFISYGGSSLWGFTILLFILLNFDARR